MKIRINPNKISLILIIAISLTSLTQSVYGQTTTTKPTGGTGEKLIDEINNLREKVASKVAELNLVEKRGIFLTVTDVTGNKISGTDITNEARITDVDELTKFSSPSSKTFGISDITGGSKISIIGLYNKQSKRILARFVATETLPVFITGVISEINKANFTITVLSEDKKNTLVDIENITKTSVYSKDDGITKLGFSKLSVSDRVHVVGYSDLEEKNRIAATRVLIFPKLPKNPNISVNQPSSDTTENPPSSPSGRVIPTNEN